MGMAWRAPTGCGADGKSGAPLMPVVEFIAIYLAAECVPVNSEQSRSARLVAAGPVQDALDELLLKFIDSFIKLDSTFHHLPDKGLQLIFQGRTLRTRIIYGRKVQPDLLEFVAC